MMVTAGTEPANVMVGMRMTHSEAIALRAAAHRNRRTVSGELRAMLRAALGLK